MRRKSLFRYSFAFFQQGLYPLNPNKTLSAQLSRRFSRNRSDLPIRLKTAGKYPMRLTSAIHVKDRPATHAAILAVIHAEVMSEKIPAVSLLEGRSLEDNNSHAKIHFIAPILKRKAALSESNSESSSLLACLYIRIIYIRVRAVLRNEVL